MPIPSEWSNNLREFVERWWKTKDITGDEYIGDAPFPQFVLTEHADSWDEFLAWERDLQDSWCFRGQRDAGWLLDTPLDRAVKKEFDGGYTHLDRESEIRKLLFRFQQQAHQYIDEPPPADDLSSWFALMQHYGVPTRFLDWTNSAHVALYFAFESDPPQDGCALWAIDLDRLEERARRLLPDIPPWDEFRERAEFVNRLLRQGQAQASNAVIVQVDPPKLDARMVAQQGFFLCKLYHQATFSQILTTMMIHPITGGKPDLPDVPIVRRLTFKRELRIEFLKRLRAMNIHRASLFPGLDGFGQALRLDLELSVKG